MTTLIARRLLQLPLILLVIYTITLGLAWLVPGNPLENPDRRPKPEVIEQMNRQYNLDSFPRFYFSYLKSATGVKWIADKASGRIDRERERAAFHQRLRGVGRQTARRRSGPGGAQPRSAFHAPVGFGGAGGGLAALPFLCGRRRSGQGRRVGLDRLALCCGRAGGGQRACGPAARRAARAP